MYLHHYDPMNISIFTKHLLPVLLLANLKNEKLSHFVGSLLINIDCLALKLGSALLIYFKKF